MRAIAGMARSYRVIPHRRHEKRRALSVPALFCAWIDQSSRNSTLPLARDFTRARDSTR